MPTGYDGFIDCDFGLCGALVFVLNAFPSWPTAGREGNFDETRQSNVSKVRTAKTREAGALLR